MSKLIGISAILLIGAAICAVIYLARGPLTLSWRLRRAEQRKRVAEAAEMAAPMVEAVPDQMNAEDAGEDEKEDKALPLSWPVRVFATFAAVLLLLLLNNTRAYAGLSPLPDEYFWQAYGASCLMIAWYLAHVWCYAVRIRGKSLTVPGLWYGNRQFDLSALQHVEEDGRHMVRLYFKCGARARLTKHVADYSKLQDMLRGNAQMAAA